MFANQNTKSPCESEVGALGYVRSGSGGGVFDGPCRGQEHHGRLGMGWRTLLGGRVAVMRRRARRRGGGQRGTDGETTVRHPGRRSGCNGFPIRLGREEDDARFFSRWCSV